MIISAVPLSKMTYRFFLGTGDFFNRTLELFDQWMKKLQSRCSLSDFNFQSEPWERQALRLC